MIPLSLRRSEAKAMRTVQVLAVKLGMDRKGKMEIGQTCDRGGNCVRDNGPKLGLVGVGCNLQVVDDGRKLGPVSNRGLVNTVGVKK